MRRILTAACAILAMTPGMVRADTAEFLGKGLSAWIKDLDSTSASVRRGGCFALGKMGLDAQRGIGLLVKRLGDEDAGVRAAAATALGDIAQAGADTGFDNVGPALQKLLRSDRDPAAQRAAAYAIGAFGKNAEPAVADLKAALKSKSSPVKQNAAWALGRIGKNVGAEAVSELCDLLYDADPLVRRDAVAALGDVGLPTAQPAVAEMVKLVRSEADRKDCDIVVLTTGLDKLTGMVGPKNANLAPDLQKLLTYPDGDVVRMSALALANIGGEAARPAMNTLSKLLDEGDPRIQELAAAGLAQLGLEAARAVPTLGRALADEKRAPTVRRNAAVALGRIGQDARNAIGPDGMGPRAEQGREALQQLKLALPQLAAALNQGQPIEVRQYAIEAIAQVPYPDNKEIIPAVLDVIQKETDPRMRHRAVWCFFTVRELKEVGAEKVLAAVLEEKGDPAVVRYDAARVLAFHLGENAPAKGAEVLLDMLNNKKLFVYEGTRTNVSSGGTEQPGGMSNVAENLGADGRFMAAQALGWMKKTANRPDVKAALQAVADEAAKDERLKRLREEALKALDAINGK
jgi:HEAT repeat protein